METKTVNTELWKAIEDGEFYLVEPDNEIGIIHKKDYAEVIVTAVNACKAINYYNPINAAKALPELIEALRFTLIHDDMYITKGVRDKIEAALKQATE